MPAGTGLAKLDGTLAGPDELSIREEVDRALKEERDRHRWVRKDQGKVHLARSYSSRIDAPPEEWRTCCGWAFGKAPGALRSDVAPGPHERLCGRGCFTMAESLGLLLGEAAGTEGE